ncbi:class I SAM-dependent methyltransferase [Flavobacterium sufflavum]|uniref:Class I SAM-dependent methyltransferase n=1 Tax=Flavobacterium sufflavum TaxID=1921138 RepID=A0A3S2WD76_9FLAO|nr:class I SAM-dependent methyltransferase [Flavobacterium sufflavum]RVT75877.1 class I SAM-dependent methyltransferase [Flavobacterium sufflavum]
MDNFKQYSQYYDLLYQDKKYKAEADYVYNSLKSINSELLTVLELGCGSGNHATFLVANGMKITGLDRSETMVDEAKSKNIPNFSPIKADVTHFKLNQTFDAAISLFHVMSYLTDNKSLINCLKSVYDHLKPGGLFLFDVWFTPAVYSQKPETRIKRLEDNRISIVRIAESVCDVSKNIVNVNFEVLIKDKVTNQLDIIKEVHPMRHFSIPELELLAKITGFELVKTEEFLTQEMPSEKTWAICVLFKKKLN